MALHEHDEPSTLPHVSLSFRPLRVIRAQSRNTKTRNIARVESKVNMTRTLYASFLPLRHFDTMLLKKLPEFDHRHAMEIRLIP